MKKTFNNKNIITIENNAKQTFKNMKDKILPLVPIDDKILFNMAMYEQVNSFLSTLISDEYDDPLSEKEFHFNCQIKGDKIIFDNRYIGRISDFRKNCEDKILTTIDLSIKKLFEEVFLENYGKTQKSSIIK